MLATTAFIFHNCKDQGQFICVDPAVDPRTKTDKNQESFSKDCVSGFVFNILLHRISSPYLKIDF